MKDDCGEKKSETRRKNYTHLLAPDPCSASMRSIKCKREYVLLYVACERPWHSLASKSGYQNSCNLASDMFRHITNPSSITSPFPYTSSSHPKT